MLRDPVADAALAADGYVVIDLLDLEEVALLRDAWAAIDGRDAVGWDPTGLATTVRHEGPDLAADDAILPVVRTPLEAILDHGAPFMSAYVVKKAGSDALPAHIDWSLVDEREDRTYGCWIALEAITEPNGVLGVVPGSHLLVGFDRTPSAPGHEWVADLVASGIDTVDLPTTPGQAVFYDHRLVHFSAPNTTDRPRLAVNIGIATAGRTEAVRSRLLAFMREGASHQIDPSTAAAGAERSPDPGTDAVIEPPTTDDPARGADDAGPVAAARPAHRRSLAGRILRRRREPAAEPVQDPRPPAPYTPSTRSGPPPTAAPAFGRDRPERDPDRYQVDLLADRSVQQRLAEAGVALVGPVLGPDQLAEARSIFEAAIGRFVGDLPDHWYPTGMLRDPALQEFIYAETSRFLTPILSPLFLPGAGQVLGGSFAVKPPTPASELGPHQDISIVDEARAFTLSGWISLVDSTEENGWLTFVPGSHRFGNYQRALAMPWAFHGLDHVLRRHARPLAARAGELILFDTSIVHGSPENRSPEPRVAMQCVLARADASFEQLVLDERTPAGQVEVFAAEPYDFVASDGYSRPPEERRAGTRPLVELRTDADELDRWCRVAGSLPVR